MVNCTYIQYTMDDGMIFQKNIPYSIRIFKIQKSKCLADPDRQGEDRV